MQQVIPVSESLYQRLQIAAKENGFPSIAQLLEMWQQRENTIKQRRTSVRNIVEFHERLALLQIY